MKFKIFLSIPTLAQGIAPLLANAEAFINGSRSFCAKSLGIEYIEDRNVVCLSLGYSLEEGHRPIKLSAVDLGKPDNEGETELAFEHCVGDRDFICHEFMIDKTGNFTLVLMEALASNA